MLANFVPQHKVTSSNACFLLTKVRKNHLLCITIYPWNLTQGEQDPKNRY